MTKKYFLASSIFFNIPRILSLHQQTFAEDERRITMAGQSRNSNTLVVPQATQALQQMKMEAAQELGIQIPADGYYGNVATRDAGSLGGYITRKLVQIAEQQLAGQSR